MAAAAPFDWPYDKGARAFFLKASLRRSAEPSAERANTGWRFPGPQIAVNRNRLSAYIWLYSRQNSGAKALPQGGRIGSIANGQYGGSQAGAILSYRLLDTPKPELALYGRLSAALNPLSQGEFALGTRVRPARHLPLALYAEQRFDAASGHGSGTAFFVAGGTGPDPVIERFSLETYGQSGYVLGGNETYFFDGSATMTRPVAEFSGATLSAGAGLWAGGQREIRRLDVGPRARFDLPVGKMRTSIAVDGRVRVAGNARPGSGAALTVSASF